MSISRILGFFLRKIFCIWMFYKPWKCRYFIGIRNESKIFWISSDLRQFNVKHLASFYYSNKYTFRDKWMLSIRSDSPSWTRVTSIWEEKFHALGISFKRARFISCTWIFRKSKLEKLLLIIYFKNKDLYQEERLFFPFFYGD